MGKLEIRTQIQYGIAA